MIAALFIAAAEAAPPANDSVSLAALGTFLGLLAGAVGAVIAAVKGKKSGVEEGKKQGRAERSTTIEGQPIGVHVTRTLSWDNHQALEQRVTKLESRLDATEKEAGERYVQLLEAGSERELRITEKLGSKLDGIARELHGRLDIHFGPKPRTPRNTH